MQKQVSQIMSKEVSRKEFLGLSALALASVFGFGSIIKMLTGHSLFNKHAAQGFGSGAYGGGHE